MHTKKSTKSSPDSVQNGDELTVYYDGSCPVCSREIAMYRRQRGADRCAWVDASTCADATFGPGLSRGMALARIHVRRADGVLVDGTRGFALLWRTLPRFEWLGRIASAGPFPFLLDAAYWAFLRIRPLWRASPQGVSSKEQP